MTPPASYSIGGLIIENRPYRPAELIALLHIDNRMKFWRAYERVKPRPILSLGPKSIILLPDAVRDFIEFYLVDSKTEREDMRRITDGRRSS